MEMPSRVVGMSYWRWWGKGQNLEAELLVVEEAMLDAESTVPAAAASLKRWELADVVGKGSPQLLGKGMISVITDHPVNQQL